MSCPREPPVLPIRLIMERQIQAIALCRVSSDEQKNNHSLDEQEKKVKATAERHHAIIVKMWKLVASSKQGRNLTRKDLKEMLEFCKSNPRVKYLIVTEPDRFMRSIEESYYYSVEFGKLGVKILFSDDELNADTMAAKIQKAMKFCMAEGSNDERHRKATDSCMTAIQAGRYPFPPPLGYRKSNIPGVPEIDPDIGPILQTALLKIAKGIASPTVALQEYNRDIEIAGIKKVPLKMDKFRARCLDPFYCGTVEKHTASVNASNPRGLHKRLITTEEHNKIIEVFNGKPKNQSGPNAAGNPLYPFSNMVVHTDCCNRVSKYNKLVGVTIKNTYKKEYHKYRCRGCRMAIDRSVVHDKVGDEISRLELTESGKKALFDAIQDIFDMEDSRISDAMAKLRSQKKKAEENARKFSAAYAAEPDGPMRNQLKADYEELARRIEYYDDKIDELGDFEARELELFSAYAIDFTNNLVHNVLNLSPYDMRLCKQLLFPNGFFVDDNENVYTPITSPIYRLVVNKKGSPEPQNSLMVRVKRL